MTEKTLQGTIEIKVREVMFPLFERYDMDSSNLDAILKWKPIVLILGNYSSGKSTFINELLGREVQRTGQAPTDDSFTIITAPGTSYPVRSPLLTGGIGHNSPAVPAR